MNEFRNVNGMNETKPFFAYLFQRCYYINCQTGGPISETFSIFKIMKNQRHFNIKIIKRLLYLCVCVFFFGSNHIKQNGCMRI